MTHATIIPCLRYKNARHMIDWLCTAFGFETHMVHEDEDSIIVHAELVREGAMVMLGGETKVATPYQKLTRIPSQLDGANTQTAYIYVSDVDAHYRQAKSHGAEILIDIADAPHGRGYSCRDPEGYIWNFGNYNPWAPAAAKDAKEKDSQVSDLSK